MKPTAPTGRKVLQAAVLGWLVSWAGTFGTLAGTGDEEANKIRIVNLQGEVKISRAGDPVGVFTQTTNQPPLNPGDRVHTSTNSRVSLRCTSNSLVTLGDSTEIEIRPPHAPGSESGLHLWQGILNLFHRNKPGSTYITTRGAPAGIATSSHRTSFSSTGSPSSPISG